jgi:hypothetical protein
VTGLVDIAISELRDLKENKKFYLKLSAVIGGEYEK